MVVVRQLVRNLVKSMVNFFSESDYSSKFLSVLGTPKYSVTLFYEFMSFHVKINRNHYALQSNMETTVWKNEKFTLTQNFSRQINYLVILLVKSLFSRNFCQKRVRVNFCNFNTVRKLPMFSRKIL